MKMRIHTLRADGLSLLEVLVVITIVGLLAGLLLPTMSRMKEGSKNIQCVATLRNLGTGFLAYAGDHGGIFPPYPTDAGNREQVWSWLISDYVGYDKETLTPAVFACPAGKKHPDFPMAALRGYSMNQYVSDPAFQNNTLTGISQALLVEEWAAASGTDRDHVMWPALGTRQNLTYQSYSSPQRKDRLAWRHQGGMNVLRKDGSVIHSLPGTSGWGAEIVWRIYADGRKWRDGALE